MVASAHLLRALALLGPLGVCAAPAPGPADPKPNFYDRSDDNGIMTVGGGEGDRAWEVQWDSRNVCAANTRLRNVMDKDGIPATTMSLEQYMLELEAASPEERLRMTQFAVERVTKKLPAGLCKPRPGRMLARADDDYNPGALLVQIVKVSSIPILMYAIHFAIQHPQELNESTKVQLVYAAVFMYTVLSMRIQYVVQRIDPAALSAINGAIIALVLNAVDFALNRWAEMREVDRVCLSFAAFSALTGALAQSDIPELGVTKLDRSTVGGVQCPNLPIHD